MVDLWRNSSFKEQILSCDFLSFVEDPKYLTWISAKLFLLFVTTYLIWGSPVVSRWLFSQWAIKELFVDQKDNVREWIFRSNLDRYVSIS